MSEHFLYVTPEKCTYCGEDLIDGSVLRYNVVTGEGRVNLVCPTKAHDNWVRDPYHDVPDEEVWELDNTLNGEVL